jgi:hypothetical protein
MSYPCASKRNIRETSGSEECSKRDRLKIVSLIYIYNKYMSKQKALGKLWPVFSVSHALIISAAHQTRKWLQVDCKTTGEFFAMQCWGPSADNWLRTVPPVIHLVRWMFHEIVTIQRRKSGVPPWLWNLPKKKIYIYRDGSIVLTIWGMNIQNFQAENL